MKQKIFELFQSTGGDLTTYQIFSHIMMAAVLGFVIFVSYMITHRGTIYSKKFNATLVILTVLTGTVMTVIGNNIALSLGMVGALSIVRFRTAIKDSRDTVYIFWAIIVGICCGVGDYMVASVGSSITFIVFCLLGCIKNDNRMLLIIRGNRNRESGIESYIYRTFHSRAILRAKNTTEETVEFIYEISATALKTAQQEQSSVSDAIYNLGGIEYVNIVMQNDEISN